MSGGTRLRGLGVSLTEGSFQGDAGGIERALASRYTEMAKIEEKSESGNQSLTIRLERTPKRRRSTWALGREKEYDLKMKRFNSTLALD
jgi:hypothetical protein